MLTLPEIVLEAGSTTPLTGTIHNPYLFEVVDVEITIHVDDDGLTVSPRTEMTIGSLPSQATTTREWELSAADTATGAYELTANVSYTTPSACTDRADATLASDVFVNRDIDHQDGASPLAFHVRLDGDTPINTVTDEEVSVIGSPTSGVSGIKNTAWEFKTNDEAGAIRYTPADALVSEPLPMNRDFGAVSGWINITSFEPGGRVFQVGAEPDATLTNGWALEVVDVDTGTALAVSQWSDNASTRVLTIPIDLNRWYFVACVLFKETSRLYVFDQDGELASSPASGSGNRGRTDDTRLLLMSGEGRDVAGRLDDVRAYSIPLSQGAVATLYEDS